MAVGSVLNTTVSEFDIHASQGVYSSVHRPALPLSELVHLRGTASQGQGFLRAES